MYRYIIDYYKYRCEILKLFKFSRPGKTNRGTDLRHLTRYLEFLALNLNDKG